MGVDLGDLAVKRSISLESLSGRVVAIDAFNILYQFISSIRQEDGTPLMDFRGNVTAHLSGLFYRNAKLLESGIKPVYVFDGPAPKLKHKTQQERKEAKKSAEEKWKKALEEERMDDARRFASATSRLTTQMIDESKGFLTALGIPWVQAPSEGEAQASMMVRQGFAHATASQDYDALLFGSPILVRNLSITGRRKVPRQDRFVMVEPEEIRLEETLSSLGITRDKLIFIGILVGTDYNEGVKRVGPKTALKIVKETSDLGSLLAYIEKKYEYQFEVDAEELIGMFLDPPYKDPGKLAWSDPDKDKVQRILVQEHDFSSERVERTLDSLCLGLKEKGAQKKLDQWFA